MLLLIAHLLNVYDVTGKFVQNEPFIINGIDNNRVAVAVTSHGNARCKNQYMVALI